MVALEQLARTICIPASPFPPDWERYELIPGELSAWQREYCPFCPEREALYQIDATLKDTLAKMGWTDKTRWHSECWADPQDLLLSKGARVEGNKVMTHTGIIEGRWWDGNKQEQFAERFMLAWNSALAVPIPILLLRRGLLDIAYRNLYLIAEELSELFPGREDADEEEWCLDCLYLDILSRADMIVDDLIDCSILLY